MTKPASKIRFKAKLLRPAITVKGGSWTFLILPNSASAKLPSRGLTTVQGTINGHPFEATLEPDGRRSHWLKVNRKLRVAAGAEVGDVVALEIMSVGEQRELRVPADLRKALAATPKARAVWADITPTSRRDWIYWITPPSGQRLARVGSATPAKCSPPGSGASVASTGLGSTVRASALPKRPTSGFYRWH